MVYKVLRADIKNNGELVLGSRRRTIVWPTKLRVGGLYFLSSGKLYKVVAEG